MVEKNSSTGEERGVISDVIICVLFFLVRANFSTLYRAKQLRFKTPNPSEDVSSVFRVNRPPLKKKPALSKNPLDARATLVHLLLPLHRVTQESIASL